MPSRGHATLRRGIGVSSRWGWGPTASKKMLTTIHASNKKALARLLAVGRTADHAFDRRVAAIVGKVRAEGDRALERFARRFDAVGPPLEISREEMRREAAKAPADVRRAIRQAARNIARVASKQIPKTWTVTVQPGAQNILKIFIATFNVGFLIGFCHKLWHF